MMTAFDGQENGPVEFQHQTVDDQSSGISLSDIFRSLLRNRLLIAACTLLFLIFAIAYVIITVPIYQASATIRIDPNRAGSLGLSDLLSLATGNSGDQILTEIAILKSDQVALGTLKALSDDQFRTFAGFDKQKMNFDPADLPLTRAQEGMLGRFKAQTIVKQVEGTQLVTISFNDRNPQTASVIANDLIATYARQNFDSRYNSVTQVRTWLSAQMDELRDRAAEAQKRLAEFQEKNNLVGTDPSNNTVIDRLKLLNERLTDAEGDRIVKEAQLRAAMSGDPAILSSLFPDAKLQSLQSDEGTLYAQYAQLSSKYGPGYPPLIELKRQMDKVKLEISRSLGNISGRLKENFDAASHTEAMFRQEFQNETNKAYALNRTQADYAVLVVEGTSSRDLYDTLQYKLQQASVDAGLNSVNMMVVDRARIPLYPVEPKKLLTLSFGLLLGLAAGIAAALLKESLTNEVTSIHEIERLGIPSLAVIPHLPLAVGEQMPGFRLITIREPRSRPAESYRALRNSILLSSIDRPPKTILITSSLPKEGKSTTVGNYAVTLAQKGARTLVVDADLRRPTLHKYFGTFNKQGLSDYIIGETDTVEVLTPIPDLPNLYLVPAGRDIAFPSEALGSAKFRSLIKQWEKEYDIVIFDSAPILSVSDTLPLVSWMDSVILVVKAGFTPLKALVRSKSLLNRAHARITGVLLNDVSDENEESGYYGKGGYEYYK
jgi:capsular exopolysaccharide synthesis family protein